MKTRIKIVELNNGEKKYYPEWSDGDGYWHHFPEFHGYPSISGYADVSYKEEKEAQKFLDGKWELETKSITYKEYP